MVLRGVGKDGQNDHAATGNPPDRSESRLSGESKSGEQEEAQGHEGNNGHQRTVHKDEEQQSGQPEAVGFWDPSLRDVRLEAMRKWTITTTFLMAFILGCLSIYWGALFAVEENLHHLNVYVVDFDSRAAPYNTSSAFEPIVGPAITQLARKLVASPEQTLGYEVMPPSAFDYDPIRVRQDVYNWDAWAAIIINPNATAMLLSAVQNGNTSYDPLGACQLVYVDSRDDTNWYDFMAPQITAFMTEATFLVGEEWTRTVLQDAGNNATLLRNAALVPQALSPAIGFSQFNLRPLYPYQTIPAVSIGLIYLIIVSFFSFSFYLPIHFKYLKPEGHPPLKFHQLILWRWVATLAAYFMLSLAYSFISLAFQINFSGGNPVTSQTQVISTTAGNSNPDAYGHGTFPVYWMLNFFGMIALGLACENVAMFVGQPWMGMWLIFWVISNVSTAFYDIDIEPTFYRFGYAWPLHYIVEGSRQILFGLHSRIGVDFAVLIAWGVVNTALFPFACYFMRWKSKHGVNEYYR